MIRAVLAPLVAVLVLGGCEKKSPGGAPAGDTAIAPGETGAAPAGAPAPAGNAEPTAAGLPADVAAGVVPEAPADAAPARAAAGPAIGFDAIPPAPPRAAVAEVQRGLEAHEKGDYETSHATFAKVVAENATYDRARYDLACALGRLGRPDEAAAELERLLARDLPSYLHRWEDDPDLDALEALPRGEELKRLGVDLLAAWRRAEGRGMPAVAEVGGAWRAGVYLHDARRFVPFTAWEPQVVGAGADVARDYAFVVRAALWQGPADSDLAGFRTLTDVHVGLYSLETLARTGDAPFSGRNEFGNGLDEIAVAPSTQGLLVRYDDVGPRTPRETVLGPDGTPRGEGGAPLRGPLLRITPDLAFLEEAAPEGVLLRGNGLVLPDQPRPAELGRGHSAARFHSFPVSPDERFVIVVSLRAECVGDRYVVRHFVDAVDVAAGTARRLAEGDGWVAAEFGADDALYLQLDRGMRRYADPASDASEPVLEGVVLAAPRAERACTSDEDLGV